MASCSGPSPRIPPAPAGRMQSCSRNWRPTDDPPKGPTARGALDRPPDAGMPDRGSHSHRVSPGRGHHSTSAQPLRPASLRPGLERSALAVLAGWELRRSYRAGRAGELPPGGLHRRRAAEHGAVAPRGGTAELRCSGGSHGSETGWRSGGGMADHPADHSVGADRDRGRLGGAHRAPPDRRGLADPECVGGHPRQRERPLKTSDGVALVGQAAKLLKSGGEPAEALAAVAELLRTGLQADRVMVWFRDTQTSEFRSVSSPAVEDEPVRMESVHAIPRDGAGVRLSLEHDEALMGVLEVVPEQDAEQREILVIIADLLAPYLASLALSADLAIEVAAQSREIEEQRRFISLVIDSLPVGLYVIDRDYRIKIWNRQREVGAPGLGRDEVGGGQVFEVLTRQPPEMLRADFDRVFQTGEILQDELDVTLGGELRSFRLSKIPMRLDGDEISHVITIGEDVTESRRIQGQIMQSEKLAAIGQLAAGVMHEINNPLATISACVAAIGGRMDALRPAERTRVDEYLEIIDKEVDRCTRIVDGLLDFSRPKGKAKAEVALNGVLEETLFLLKHHQKFKRLTLIRELDGSIPAITGNAEQLTQVFMALMLNAVDAMHEGRGKLTVRTGRNPNHSDEVLAEIEDNGVGIPRSDQSKIFEPFYTTKPPGRGTGLGLSICYGIVEDHRGRIEVESQPGRGSTFRVFLPVHP